MCSRCRSSEQERREARVQDAPGASRTTHAEDAAGQGCALAPKRGRAPAYGRQPTVSSSLLIVALATMMSACHREHREFQAPPQTELAPTQVRLSPLIAGPATDDFRQQMQSEYEGNAYHLSEGKRLFTWFNCVGCHGHGGGGSGPPLMDDQWIYGGEIDQIYLTIVQGRPNGMPAFGGKIPPQQVWQLSAYVRSMAGHGPKSARPGRDDHIQKPSEQGRRDEPVNRAPNPTAETS